MFLDIYLYLGLKVREVAFDSLTHHFFGQFGYFFQIIYRALKDE